MISQSVLSRVPVLRILVPLMAGIVMHRLWHCVWMPLVLMAVAVAVYVYDELTHCCILRLSEFEDLFGAGGVLPAVHAFD